MKEIIRKNKLIFSVNLVFALIIRALANFSIFGFSILLQQVVTLNRSDFFKWIIILFLVMVLEESFKFLEIVFKAKFRVRLELSIRDKTYDSMIKNRAFSTEGEPSKFLSWLDGDVVRMRGSIEGIINMIVSIFVIIFRFVLLFYFGWYVALISFVSFLILLLFPIILNGTFTKLGKSLTVARQVNVSKSENFFRGYMVFLHANRRSGYLKLLKKIQERLQRKIDRQSTKLSLSYLAFNFLGIALQIVGDLIVGILIMLGIVPIGAFLASTSYMGSNMADSMNLNQNFISIYSTKPLFKRIKIKGVTKIEGAEISPPEFKELTLDSVTFSYQKEGEEKILFKDLNFSFLRAKRYAIVGPSGSGKSTLVYLLTSYLKPLRGSITYNGQDIVTYLPGELNKRLGVIIGSWTLLKTKLRHNLTLFDSSFSDKQLKDVLKMVNLSELDLDEEVDSKKLSSGQIQRISIARWLLTPTEILVLDEAFSNIDKANRRLIRRELFSREGLTIIEITHHLEMRKEYDKVIDISEFAV